MTDLHAAIRRELDQFCVSDICAEKGKAAILGVLEAHPLDENHLCAKDDDVIPESWYGKEPCPTLLAIAKGLGIEVEE